MGLYMRGLISGRAYNRSNIFVSRRMGLYPGGIKMTHLYEIVLFIYSGGTLDTNPQFPNKKFRPAFQRSWSSPTKTEENKFDAEHYNNNNNKQDRMNSGFRASSTESKIQSEEGKDKEADRSQAQIK